MCHYTALFDNSVSSKITGRVIYGEGGVFVRKKKKNIYALHDEVTGSNHNGKLNKLRSLLENSTSVGNKVKNNVAE